MKKTMAILVLALCLALSACDRRGSVSAPEKRIPAEAWHNLLIGQFMTLSESVATYKSVLRVPGGWVVFYKGGYGCASCFVPLSDEGKE